MMMRFLFFLLLINISFSQKKPNIVLIMADDLGYESISVNGGKSYLTPNIDMLAKKGVRFINCHSEPICTPSRVRIMTGKTGKKNYLDFAKLDKNETVFSQLLKENGYKTLIAGKWQLGKEANLPNHFGFDEHILWQHKLPRTDSVGHDTRYPNPILDVNGLTVNYDNGSFGPDVIVDYINEFVKRNKKTPFLVYYPMLLTHCPFIPTPDSDDFDPESKGSLEYKGNPIYFGDMVNYMDKLVGRIYNNLKDLKLLEETVIIFTSDNGTDAPIVSKYLDGEMEWGKGKTTDNGTHAPLVVSWKGHTKQGVIDSSLIDFSDFLPTLCDISGIKVSKSFDVDGISFLPQILGKENNKKKFIHTWYYPRPYQQNISGDNWGRKEFEWTRNKIFKLYSDGRFYNVKDDFYEKNPINIEKMNKIQSVNYKLLKKGLESYEKITWKRKI